MRMQLIAIEYLFAACVNRSLLLELRIASVHNKGWPLRYKPGIKFVSFQLLLNETLIYNHLRSYQTLRSCLDATNIVIVQTYKM